MRASNISSTNPIRTPSDLIRTSLSRVTTSVNLESSSARIPTSLHSGRSTLRLKTEPTPGSSWKSRLIPGHVWHCLDHLADRHCAGRLGTWIGHPRVVRRLKGQRAHHRIACSGGNAFRDRLVATGRQLPVDDRRCLHRGLCDRHRHACRRGPCAWKLRDHSEDVAMALQRRYLAITSAVFLVSLAAVFAVYLW